MEEEATVVEVVEAEAVVQQQLVYVVDVEVEVVDVEVAYLLGLEVAVALPAYVRYACFSPTPSMLYVYVHYY